MGISFSNVAHVNGDGSFAWKNVPAGNYAVPDFRGQRYAGLVSKIRDRGAVM